MVGIVPKSKSKADFCGTDDNYYIVRPDLKCYMKSTNFHEGLNIEIFSLHHACADGDHYLANDKGFFYIIKGNYFRRVTNMNEDLGAAVYSLHPNCQGGDHYLAAFGYFYVIFKHRNCYRKTADLHTDDDSVDYTFHPECKNGLYYWGTRNYYYFVKPDDKWGVEYVKCTNFHTNDNNTAFSFHKSVLGFLPGGLPMVKGPTYGEWVCIKSIKNDSQSAVTWQKEVTKSIGYEKEKMSSIEKNWKVSSTVSGATGGLTALIVQSTFQLSAEYGGNHVDTTRENWREATEIKETISLSLQPQKAIYIFVYRLGLGKEPLLHCRDMKLLDSPEPPASSPLPPSKN